MARILVTGGHGFLGSRLRAALVAAGDEVIAPSIDELELTDERAFERLSGPFDAVVHAAAFVPPAAPSPDDIPAAIRAGALATHNVLRFARRASVRRFVSISSSDVYAPTAPIPVNEGAPVGPQGPAMVYALGKLWGEQVTRVHHEAYGLETVTLRFTILYGAGMRERGVLAAFWKRAGAGEVLEVRSPEASNDYLHVDDAVRAIRLALAAPKPEPTYNIGGGREVSLAELARTICRVRGVDERLIVTGDAQGRRFCLDTTRAREGLKFEALLSLETGLRSMLVPPR